MFLPSAASDVNIHGLHRNEGQLLLHRRTPTPPPLPAVHRCEHDHVDVPVGVVVVSHVDVGHVVVIIVVVIVVVIVVAVLVVRDAGGDVDDAHEEVEEGEGGDAGGVAGEAGGLLHFSLLALAPLVDLESSVSLLSRPPRVFLI